MNKFLDNQIHDKLDQTIFPLAEVITRLPFTWSDYSCGGHLDKDVPNDLDHYMRISNGTIFIAIHFDIDHPGAAECIEKLEDYMLTRHTYGSIRNSLQDHSQKYISIKFVPEELIQTRLIKARGWMDIDRTEKYISWDQVRAIYRNNQKIIRELTAIFSSFLTESDSQKVIQMTSNKMTGFLLRHRHET